MVWSGMCENNRRGAAHDQRARLAKININKLLFMFEVVVVRHAERQPHDKVTVVIVFVCKPTPPSHPDRHI